MESFYCYSRSKPVTTHLAFDILKLTGKLHFKFKNFITDNWKSAFQISWKHNRKLYFKFHKLFNKLQLSTFTAICGTAQILERRVFSVCSQQWHISTSEDTQLLCLFLVSLETTFDLNLWTTL